MGAAVSNHGRKLKRKARTVHEGRLGTAYGAAMPTEVCDHFNWASFFVYFLMIVKVVEYASKRRAIIRLKSSPKDTRFSDDEDEYGGDVDDIQDDDDDPYAGIDLEGM